MKRSNSDDVLLFSQWAEHREQWPLLADYLLTRSGLPGPRANLSLAGEFAVCFARPEVPEASMALLASWTELPGKEADGKERDEYLPFCAVQAYGAYYGYAESGSRPVIEAKLQAAMNDPRWRVREAAAIGLQRIGEFGFGLLQSLLEGWRAAANALEQRAFIAALAHPPLLKDPAHTAYCLKLSEDLLDAMLAGKYAQADPEHLRVLWKGLEYALSLFVASEPEAGFDLLNKLAGNGDKAVLRIVKSNLAKKRLSQKYPGQVSKLLAGLTNA